MPPILSRQATMLDNMIDRSFLGAMSAASRDASLKCVMDVV